MTVYVPVMAHVDKFKLEVMSNLKISTLKLKLGSSDCNKSMRGIQAVTVRMNNSPPSWGPNLRHTAAQVP